MQYSRLMASIKIAATARMPWRMGMLHRERKGHGVNDVATNTTEREAPHTHARAFMSMLASRISLTV